MDVFIDGKRYVLAETKEAKKTRFPPGSLVRVKNERSYGPRVGAYGIVVIESPTRIGVQFINHPVWGHNLEGNITQDKGWWYYEDEKNVDSVVNLEVIEERVT